MAKTRKNKKPNMVKRYEQAARVALKGTMIAFVAGKDGNEAKLISRKTLKEIPCTERLATALQNCQFKWSVMCAVTLRKPDGSEGIETDFRRLSQPYRQSRIAGWFNDVHKKLLKEVDPSERLTAAWIACPAGLDITERECVSVFDYMGAWDFKAEFEGEL